MIVPSWDETLLDLHRAETVVELWSVLVVWHGIRSCAAWEEPYALFRRFHESEPNGAVVTAALLCTDHRFLRRSTVSLVDRFGGFGLGTARRSRSTTCPRSSGGIAAWGPVRRARRCV